MNKNSIDKNISDFMSTYENVFFFETHTREEFKQALKTLIEKHQPVKLESGWHDNPYR